MTLIVPSFRKEIGQRCPKCGLGDLTLRKSIYGFFLGCTCYPACRYSVGENMIEIHKGYMKLRDEVEKKIKKKGLKTYGKH